MSTIQEILQSHLDTYEEAFESTNELEFAYKMTHELDILQAKIEAVKGIMNDLSPVHDDAAQMREWNKV